MFCPVQTCDSCGRDTRSPSKLCSHCRPHDHEETDDEFDQSPEAWARRALHDLTEA